MCGMSSVLSPKEVLELLSKSLLFYPVIRAVIAAAGMVDDDRGEAIKTIVTGAAINVVFITTVVLVVSLLRLI